MYRGILGEHAAELADLKLKHVHGVVGVLSIGRAGRHVVADAARHRLHEPDRPVVRAAEAGIVAVLGACRSARDQLIVLLMARARSSCRLTHRCSAEGYLAA